MPASLRLNHAPASSSAPGAAARGHGRAIERREAHGDCYAAASIHRAETDAAAQVGDAGATARAFSVAPPQDRSDVGIGQTMEAMADDPLFDQFARRVANPARPSGPGVGSRDRCRLIQGTGRGHFGRADLTCQYQCTWWATIGTTVYGMAVTR